jgi:hypothetical protein
MELHLVYCLGTQVPSRRYRRSDRLYMLRHTAKHLLPSMFDFIMVWHKVRSLPSASTLTIHSLHSISPNAHLLSRMDLDIVILAKEGTGFTLDIQ